MNYEFESLIDTDEAATLIGVHPKILQRMARNGTIPGHRVGKFWRFRKSELDVWLKADVNYARYAYRPSMEDQP